VIDTTGIKAFIADRIARERAGLRGLPVPVRGHSEKILALLEAELSEHGPDPSEKVYGEPLCSGCAPTIAVWPCDFALRAAMIWSDDKNYRGEWGDALDPLRAR
jgi:hypothetical protein